MSYDIRLVGAQPMDEPFQEGGTQCIGGTTECELNVTYNYAQMFDFRSLHGRTAMDTLPGLLAFADQWGGCPPFSDYWAPTPGNVCAAVKRLISFAERNPNCVWEVS